MGRELRRIHCSVNFDGHQEGILVGKVDVKLPMDILARIVDYLQSLLTRILSLWKILREIQESAFRCHFN